MDKTEVRGQVVEAIAKHFPRSVADALIADEMLYRIVDEMEGCTPLTVDTRLARIGKVLTNEQAGWLAIEAESPANWVRNRL